MRRLKKQLDIFKPLIIMPQQTAGIIERFGKFSRQISAGYNFKWPFIEDIAYIHNLKEETVHVDSQTVITKDNVSLQIDGMLFIKIQDPYKVSYSIDKPQEAIAQLTLTLMRNEIGKIELDKLFQERDNLNEAILLHLKEKTDEWGIQCMRYEILNIDPPESIKISMQQEAEAERNKRRDILISEGKRQAEINLAEGQKTSIIYKAEGQSKSVQIKAEKEYQSIQMISSAIKESNLSANYMLTQNYLDTLENNLKDSKVVVYPDSPQGKEQDWLGFAAMMMLNNNNTDINKNINQNTKIAQQQQPQLQNTVNQYIEKEIPQVFQQKKKYDNSILDSD